MRAKFSPEALKLILRSLMEQDVVVQYASRTPNADEFELVIEGPYDEDVVREIIRRADLEYRWRRLEEYDSLGLKDKTRADVEDYIDANVTDLPTAKAFLKKLSCVVLYLYKREMDFEG